MADREDHNPTIALSDAALSNLPPRVSRPRYDRSLLTPGIVHIGLGNFHRAHQAWYVHRLMQAGEAQDWAIVGAGVKLADAVQRQRLLAQDGLTTLIELDPAGKSAEVTGPMIDFAPIEADNASLIRQMADPRIRLASLTVTEGGYFIDPSTGEFDAEHPDIQHDIAQPNRPKTAFGAMIIALSQRRSAGERAFTCLSCDNLQGNGKVLRQTVVSLARHIDPDLADWINGECAFPNSMVDCIVPSTGPDEIALARSFGVADAAPVTHEAFRQWVLEDCFSAGRPRWEDAGAIISPRVHDYEMMKIRMLNGGHQVIACVGDLLGLKTIAETMAHPLIRRLLRKVMIEEIAPHVRPTPDTTPESYLDLIERRFANPEIADTTRRVAFDGSSRQSGFIVPSIRDGLSSGQPIDGLALVSALWNRYCDGGRDDGSIIEPNDPNWTSLQRAARASRADPMKWLGLQNIYGDVGQNPRLLDAFSKWQNRLWTKGIEQTLHDFVTG